jgi:hypothetical protein
MTSYLPLARALVALAAAVVEVLAKLDRRSPGPRKRP